MITLRSPRVRLQKVPGGFRREVQPRRQHWFLNKKSRFPIPNPAFCSLFQGTKTARREGKSRGPEPEADANRHSVEAQGRAQAEGRVAVVGGGTSQHNTQHRWRMCYRRGYRGVSPRHRRGLVFDSLRHRLSVSRFLRHCGLDRSRRKGGHRELRRCTFPRARGKEPAVIPACQGPKKA